MHEVTPLRVLAVLAFYAALLLIMRLAKRHVEPAERRTFLLIGVAWAVPVFIANYLLFRAGVMSFLPWVTNFMHTFIWIGGCLAFLYLAVRETEPLIVQIALFATFSLIVKYAEQIAFGTWDLDNFFGIDGNFAYVLGWSLADGSYPVLTLWGLRIAAQRVPGLLPT